MLCDAHIRPMRPVNDTQIICDLDGGHPMHRGRLRDYAYPGSVTAIEWHENDRRTFHGDWPGDCPGCILPLGHSGNHAS